MRNAMSAIRLSGKDGHRFPGVPHPLMRAPAVCAS